MADSLIQIGEVTVDPPYHSNLIARNATQIVYNSGQDIKVDESNLQLSPTKPKMYKTNAI